MFLPFANWISCKQISSSDVGMLVVSEGDGDHTFQEERREDDCPKRRSLGAISCSHATAKAGVVALSPVRLSTHPPLARR